MINKDEMNMINNDTLQILLSKQEELDNEIIKSKNLEYKEYYKDINEKCDATLGELVELKEECNGIRFWKKNKVSPTRIREEIVDVAHFLFSMINTMFDNGADFAREYIKKNLENKNRLKKGGKWNE